MAKALRARARAEDSEARFPVTVVPDSRPVPKMAEDIRRGLSSRPRVLFPKYLYDQRGSELFDRICDQPEYYPTRTEFTLLAQHAGAIIEETQPDHLIEYGSGASRKTRALLDAWSTPGVYWPFDVSEEMLVGVARGLHAEYPELDVHGLVGDYTAGLRGLPAREGRTLAAFLGSTLGNFDQDEEFQFLSDVRQDLREGDWLLLGLDMWKDSDVLRAAYNDSAGVTAAFNLNLLDVLNRSFEADFDAGGFRHEGIVNRDEKRVEMHLIAERDQQVSLPKLDLELELRRGDSIRSEISRKFELDGLADDLQSTGFVLTDRFISPDPKYALILAKAR